MNLNTLFDELGEEAQKELSGDERAFVANIISQKAVLLKPQLSNWQTMYFGKRLKTFARLANAGDVNEAALYQVAQWFIRQEITIEHIKQYINPEEVIAMYKLVLNLGINNPNLGKEFEAFWQM
jgi:hypothetical protein